MFEAGDAFSSRPSIFGIYVIWGCRWMFPKMGVPENGWFIMEHLIKLDDLGVPLFLETPRCSEPEVSI